MNHVVTIPKKIARQGNLVVLPRVEFEALRRSLLEQARLIGKKILDADLAEALREYKAGKYYGPFETAQEGIAFLKSRRAKK